MGTFFVYILKSALCLAAYYLFYKLLMSSDTFHRFNRFALVTLLLCSMALPLLQFNLETTPEVVTGSAEIDLSGLAMVEAVTEVETPLWTKLVAVLILVYLLGIVFFALRTLVSYLSLWRLIRRCEERPLPTAFAHAKARLMVTQDSVSPFSWMHYVVVNERDLQENERAILLHELGHIANHHTLDLILTEVCLIMQWFNPAIWLLREELQAIHEFEADEAVLDAGVNAREYQLLLIKKAAGSRLQSITNSLHQSSIKKRITMMQKKKSNPWARAKYAFAVPVAALSVALFATPTASALSAEISGCKVSDLFSVDQDSNPKNCVTIVYQAGVEGYSAHLIDENGAIQPKALTDEDLKDIYSKEGLLTLKIAKDTPMKYVGDLKKRCKELNIIKLSYSDSESVYLNFIKEDLSSPTSPAIQYHGSLSYDDEVKTVCEVEPEFPGGSKELMKFIAEKLRYPSECAEKGIEGRVTLSFIVEKDGSITNIEELRSPDPRLTAEAKRVLSLMPNWTPGKQDGEAVRVKYMIPVTFRKNAGYAVITIDDVKPSTSKTSVKFGGQFDGLTLLDDQPISPEELNKLSTNLIESVEVLKDESNISKYIGQYPEAKNGIIKITTKK